MTDRGAIPPLLVTTRDRAAERPPGPSSLVQVWRDHDGTVSARGWTDRHGHHMEIPGVGVFGFGDRESGPVTVAALPGADRAVVEDTYRRMVLPMVLQVRGEEVLHSSAVLGPTGVVALCGTSGTGKSTLAFALGRRGHPLWADDCVAFAVDGASATARPLPFRVRLRPSSAAFFQEADEGGEERWRVRTGSGPAPLAAVCVLERTANGSGIGIERLEAGSSAVFRTVLPHAYCFSLDDTPRKRAMMANYLALVRAVPVHVVRTAPGLEHVGPIVEGIEARVMDGHAGRAAAPER